MSNVVGDCRRAPASPCLLNTEERKICVDWVFRQQDMDDLEEAQKWLSTCIFPLVVKYCFCYTLYSSLIK